MQKLYRLSLLVSLCSAPFTAVADDPKYPWLDDMHESLSERVGNSARWLDNFFAIGDSTTQLPDARGEARVQLGWEPRSRKLNEFQSRVRVKVKLPKLKNRADLVLSDFDEDLENAPVKAAQNDVVPNQNEFNLALRWQSEKQEFGGRWSHRVGVGRGVQAFGRSSYTHVSPLGENSRIRWQVEGYLYSGDGLGSHLGAQYEYRLESGSLIRQDNNYYYRDETNDWFWQHSIQRLSAWGDNSAVIYGLYTEGVSQPNFRAEEYLTSVRWRRQALRQWLYFEVEPFVLWTRTEDFNPSYGVALRVEGFFGNL